MLWVNGLVQGFTRDEDAPTYYPKRIQAIGNAKNLGFKIIDEASAEADLQKKNKKQSNYGNNIKTTI